MTFFFVCYVFFFFFFFLQNSLTLLQELVETASPRTCSFSEQICAGRNLNKYQTWTLSEIKIRTQLSPKKKKKIAFSNTY